MLLPSVETSVTGTGPKGGWATPRALAGEGKARRAFARRLLRSRRSVGAQVLERPLDMTVVEVVREDLGRSGIDVQPRLRVEPSIVVNAGFIVHATCHPDFAAQGGCSGGQASDVANGFFGAASVKACFFLPLSNLQRSS